MADSPQFAVRVHCKFIGFTFPPGANQADRCQSTNYLYNCYRSMGTDFNTLGIIVCNTTQHIWA